MLFGKTEKFIDTPESVFHLEEDLYIKGNILFSGYYSIRTTDGRVHSLVAGGTSRGYNEGIGSAARFYGLYGFIQIRSTHVILADNSNHCIRVLDRESRETSKLAGTCTQIGYRDGYDALFFAPFGITSHWDNENLVLVAATDNDAVRIVNINSGYTSTLIKSGLTSPINIRLDKVLSTVLITDQYSVKRYDYISDTLHTISSVGEDCGSGICAVYDVLRIGDLFVFAESANNTLRAIDVHSSTMTSICRTTEACVKSRRLSLLRANDILYFGGIRVINRLPVTVIESGEYLLWLKTTQQ